MPSLKKPCKVNFKNILLLGVFLGSSVIWATPLVPMNKAFNSLMELIPFLSSEPKFTEKENEKFISTQLKEMNDAFKTAKHDSLLKQDIFAPSMEAIRTELHSAEEAFREGKKNYAWWRIRTITSQCMSCHTRLPENHSSSFQDGSRLINPTKFSDPYHLGIAQLIVRQYPEAKASFTKTIDESLIKKDFKNILLPLKQILLIQTKVFKDASQMLKVIEFYEKKKGISLSDREVMRSWKNRLKVWATGPFAKWKRISVDQEAETFINTVMKPLFKNNNLYVGKHDVDLLMAQGLLSNFLFENPEAGKAPDALYWIGISEKFLERENFFGPGELFFKECIVRYPKNPIAKECFDEYKESIEFNFSGSRGTDIPPEIKKELEKLESLIKQ